MRAPSPRRGEGGVRGFGVAGRVSDGPSPLTPPSPRWGEGEERGRGYSSQYPQLLFAYYFMFFARNAIERCQARSAAAF